MQRMKTKGQVITIEKRYSAYSGNTVHSNTISLFFVSSQMIPIEYQRYDFKGFSSLFCPILFSMQYHPFDV